jgi:hypothetical protein
MAELGDIINMRCPVKFDWHGESIEIAYRPYSEKIEHEIKGGADWGLESMTNLVLAVGLDWNITSKGEPLPISEDVLKQLPVELRLSLFIAVQNDLRNPQLPSVTSTAS